MKNPCFAVVIFLLFFSYVNLSAQTDSRFENRKRVYCPKIKVEEQEYTASLRIIDSMALQSTKASNAQKKPNLPIINQELDFETTNLNNWEVYSGVSTGAINVDFEDRFFQLLGGGVTIDTLPFDNITAVPLQSPLGGKKIAAINRVPVGARSAKLRGKIHVDENNNLLKFACIAVLEQTFHHCDQTPFIAVQLRDSIGTILYKYLIQPLDSGGCHGHNQIGMGITFPNPNYYNYSNWQLRCVDLSEYIGQNIFIEFIASGCSYSQHEGYGYFDAKLESCPPNFKPATLSIDNYTVDLHQNHFQYSSTNCSDSVKLELLNTTVPFLWNGLVRNSTTYTTSSPSISSYRRDHYTLLFQNDTSCPITKSFYIQSNPEFTIRVSAGNLCQNRKAYFTIEGVPTAIINGLSYKSYYIDSITSTGIYSITASAYSKYGCYVTRTFTFNVSPAPSIAITGPNGFCGNGDIVVNGSGASTYTWSYIGAGSSSLTTGTGPTFSISVPNFSVQVVGQSTAGCRNTAFYSTVRSSTFAIGMSANSYSVCASTSLLYHGLTISGSNTGSTPTSFSITEGANSFSLTAPGILSITPTSTKIYSISAANNCGIATKTLAVLVSTLTPTLSFSAPTNIAPCIFTVGLNGADSYSAGPWATVSGSVATYSYPFFTTPSVIATFSNSYCSDTQTLQYVSPSTVALQPTVGICVGSVINFSISSNTAANYTVTPYYFPGFAITQFTAGASFSYTIPSFFTGITIEFMDNNGCIRSTNFSLIPSAPNFFFDVNGRITNSVTLCTGQSASVTLQGAPNYSLNSIPTNSTFVLSPTATAVYTISAANACLQTSQTLTLTPVNAVLGTATITPNGTACINKSLILSASGASSYTWHGSNSFNSSVSVYVASTSTVLLSYTDINGCIRSYSPYVIVPVTASISVPPNQIYCGSTAQSYTASGGQTYTWSVNSYSYAGTIFNYQFQSGTYREVIVNATAANGCVATGSFQVISHPPMGFQFKPAYNKCWNFHDTLDITSNSPVITYTWSNGSNNPFILVPQNPQMVYSLTITNTITGCTASGTVVSSAPINTTGFNISVSSNTVCNGASLINYTFSPVNGFTPTINGAFLQGLHPTLAGTFPMYGYYIDNNACYVASSNTQIITVVPKPSVQLNLSSNQVCSGDSVGIVVFPSGGTFYGQNAMLPSFVAGQPSRKSVAYRYSDQNNCSSVDYTCLSVEECLGVRAVENDLYFTISPNPFIESFLVESNYNGQFIASVVDINGREIFKQTALQSCRIESSNWPSGIYVLQLQSAHGNSKTKIIKQP